MNKSIKVLLFALLLAPLFYMIARYNYILYHIAIEAFSFTIGVIIFNIAIISQKYSANTIIERFGYGLGCVSILVLLHAVTYKGLNIIPGYDANLQTQLWVVLSYVQAISLLISICSVNKNINKWYFITIYTILTVILAYFCFARLFPDCYVEGIGLTPFKKNSEYIIIIIYIVCLLLLHKKNIWQGLKKYGIAIIMLILSSFAFTLNSNLDGIQNFLGHYFRLIALAIFYISIVVTNIREPYDNLFSDLKNLSEKDSLTQLYNRNYMNDILKTSSKKDNNEIYVVLFDIDDFKSINDTYGHDIGDTVLKDVAEILQSNVRVNDIAIRYGGDEFLILFTKTSLSDAKKIWERINLEIKQHMFSSNNIKITLCAGFGIYKGNFEDTFKTIDTILLNAKKDGKNKTSYYFE